MNTDELLNLNDITKYFPILGGLFKSEVATVNVLNGIDLTNLAMTYRLLECKSCFVEASVSAGEVPLTRRICTFDAPKI